MRPSWINLWEQVTSQIKLFSFFIASPCVRGSVHFCKNGSNYLPEHILEHSCHSEMCPYVPWDPLAFLTPQWLCWWWFRSLCYRIPKYFQDMRPGFFQFLLSLTAGKLVLRWVFGFIPQKILCLPLWQQFPPLFHTDLLSNTGLSRTVSAQQNKDNFSWILSYIYLGFENMIRSPVIPTPSVFSDCDRSRTTLLKLR